MTLIIRIPKYTYCKSQNHYLKLITTVIKIRWIFQIYLEKTLKKNLENMQTFYVDIILPVMVPILPFS